MGKRRIPRGSYNRADYIQGLDRPLMRIIDRYILRQLAWPFALGLVVFTFLLIVPQLMRYAEEYVSKGVSLWIVGRLILTLLPYSLALTIPMSLLLALLVAFGRLSADREFVALQACGVSLYRLFRPVMRRRNGQLPCHGLRLYGADSGRQSDLPGNHLQHHGGQCGERGQASDLLRRIPERRPLRPRVAADGRLGWGLHRG